MSTSGELLKLVLYQYFSFIIRYFDAIRFHSKTTDPPLIMNLHKYTVNHKKRDILFLTITLANLDRFLQFLYHFNHEEILHATVVKFTTSP